MRPWTLILLLSACTGAEDPKDSTTGTETDLDVDADGDGVLVADDCDDADPTVYPGAPEACDGKDNDCDAATPDAAGATFDDGGGAVDVTAAVNGNSVTPLAWTTPSAGTLAVCGTVYTQITATADLTIVGEGAGVTILDGADAGTVVQTATAGVTVTLESLTVQYGAGTEVTDLGIVGGGLLCNGGEALVLSDVDVTKNRADTGGGIAALYGCAVQMTGGSISTNTAADAVGGLALFDAAGTLSGVTVSGNDARLAAGGIGAEYLFGITPTAITLVDTVVRDNLAAVAAGVYVLSGTGSCTGGGILANENQGLSLYNTAFTATGCDFGEPGSADDNVSADVVNDVTTYTFGDDASFVCNGASCT